MNAKTIIIAAVTILVLLGMYLGVKSYSKNKQAVAIPTAQGLSQATTTETTATVSQILESGMPYTCTFSGLEDQDASGTVHLASGNIRADLRTNSQLSHIIIRDNIYYYWTEGSSQGQKTEINLGANGEITPGVGTMESLINGMTTNSNVNYKCEEWEEDSTMFSLPEDVEFVDSSIDHATQCDACENLSGEAREQCLTTLSCN